MSLDDLNQTPPETAREAFLACCGSRRWADRMVAGRPLRDLAALRANAEAACQSLAREDWLEAFSRHPRIGENSSAKWSSEEQHGMSGADRETNVAIQQLNEQYESRFGWIFIVCATGKSAGEMHTLLERRLSHNPEEELCIAAAEQIKIMHLRLDKLLAE